MAAAAPVSVDDVPLLVRVLAGNSVTAAAILSCLNTADTRALRQLHTAVVGVVADVPWYDTATPVVDAVRWRAALPAAVSVKLAKELVFSAGAVEALAGITRLDLQECANVSDELLCRLPTSLRTLNVRWCHKLTARASFAHLTALVSLDCSETRVVRTRTAGLPPSLQELSVGSIVSSSLPAGVSLAHLSQLRVLRASKTDLNDGTLASLPPTLVGLDVGLCSKLTAAASFAQLPALQTLHAGLSALCEASLATLPPSLVSLDVSGCKELTRTAVLPPLPALRLLDVSDTMVGDALVASLPAGLEELRIVRCGGVTTGATLDHVPSLRALYSMCTALAPAVAAACRARGCAAPAAGELHGHPCNVTALVVLADGRLASGDDDGEVRLWDVAGGGDVVAVLRASGRVCELAALPDGRRLAAGTFNFAGYGGRIEVWDVTSAPPVQFPSVSFNSIVSALVVLADGRLAAGCLSGGVRVVDVDACVVAAELGGQDCRGTALAGVSGGAPGRGVGGGAGPLLGGGREGGGGEAERDHRRGAAPGRGGARPPGVWHS